MDNFRAFATRKRYSICVINNRKILYGGVVLIALVFIVGVAVSKKSSLTGQTADPRAVEATTEKMRKQFMESMREVRGTVRAISSSGGEYGQTLSVSIQVPDVVSAKLFVASSPELIEKNIVVIVDGSTSIDGPSDFKVGDTVHVLLNRSVYNDGGDFTALKISIFDRTREIMKQITGVSMINGVIKKIGNNVIILIARVPDTAKLSTLDVSGSFTVPYVEKEYKILVNANTEFPRAQLKALKVGVSISAWGEGDLLNSGSFTATKIINET